MQCLLQLPYLCIFIGKKIVNEIYVNVYHKNFNFKCILLSYIWTTEQFGNAVGCWCCSDDEWWNDAYIWKKENQNHEDNLTNNQT